MSLKVNEKSQNLILLFFYAIIKIENNGEIYNMEYIGIILLLFSIFLFYQIKKLKKEIQEKDRLIENEYQELKKEKEEQLNNEVKGLVFQKNQLQSDLNGLNNSIKEKETFNNSLLRIREDELNSLMREKEEKARLHIKHNLEQYYVLQRAEKESQLKAVEEASAAEKEKLQTEINQLSLQLSDFKARRDTINEEIRKQEEKEKYNEIHSINLTDFEKEDIHFLLSLEDRLHNKQLLYKLVWSTYLQQAYKNTFHNILGNRDPKNVIYCIENINNGKKYIGKTSAEVSKRWTEHIKTSLNIGTIKTTNIHKALYNHWDEFIFYIIIETEKDKLSELEKFYINFYESDKYGYNIKSGG